VNVTNSFGCIASGKLGLKVYPLPDITLTKDTSVCSGQSVILDAGNAGSSFLWSTGSTQQSIQAFMQGQYWVNVKSQFGCEKSDTVQLHINPLPRLSLNRQAGLCEGSKVQLKPEVESTDYTYQWNDGSTEPTLNVSEPGAYWVIVSNGLCLTIDTTEVVLLKNKLPAINDFQTLCPNTTIQLSAYSTEAAAYQWNTGETGNSIQVNKQGVYTVHVQGRYCNYSRNDTIRVQTGQLPAVHIVADDTSICEGDRIRLLAIGNDVEGYRWQDGNFGPLYVARNPGYYTVQVFNQCGIADDSINLILSAHCIVSILVPTAFSPNGDGVNDVFRPVVRHQIYNYELRIFNRWGQLVFLSNNPEQGWDGTFHGTPCEVGGYAWWIKYSQVQNGPPVFKKGVLTLVR
jgi:gliding motility-associated-like protein